MRHAIVTAACVAILSSGCTNLTNEMRIDREHGARRGVVTRLIDGAIKSSERPVCLAELPEAAVAQRQYVEVRYRHDPRHYDRLEAGALPPGVLAQPGDAVEFYPKNCGAGLVSTLIRVLPPSTP